MGEDTYDWLFYGANLSSEELIQFAGLLGFDPQAQVEPPEDLTAKEKRKWLRDHAQDAPSDAGLIVSNSGLSVVGMSPDKFDQILVGFMWRREVDYTQLAAMEKYAAQVARLPQEAQTFLSLRDKCFYSQNEQGEFRQ